MIVEWVLLGVLVVAVIAVNIMAGRCDAVWLKDYPLHNGWEW